MKPASSIKGITKAMFLEGQKIIIFPKLSCDSLKPPPYTPHGYFYISFIIALMNHKATKNVNKM